MKITLAILSLLSIPFASFAFLVPTNPPAVVQLAWDPAPQASEYRVYMGLGSRQYTNVVSAGLATGISVTLPVRGTPYFFAVTVRLNGLESDFSNEVSYTPQQVPPPPNMKTIVVLTVQSKSAGSQYADTQMNWSLAPDQTNQLFRLRISQYPQLAIAAKAKAPPVPWTK